MEVINYQREREILHGISALICFYIYVERINLSCKEKDMNKSLHFGKIEIYDFRFAINAHCMTFGFGVLMSYICMTITHDGCSDILSAH